MEIKTTRLLLREFEESDWRAIMEYHSLQEYLRYYPWTERNEEDSRSFIQQFIDWQGEEPRLKYQLAATLLANRTFIGSIGVRVTNREAGEAELGIELNPYYWHKGYAFEAAQVMLRLAFRDLDLHRIWAQCVTDNIAVRRLLEKLGMHKEGVMRHNQRFKSRWWDTIYYGILKEEWLQTFNLWHLYVE